MIKPRRGSTVGISLFKGKKTLSLYYISLSKEEINFIFKEYNKEIEQQSLQAITKIVYDFVKIPGLELNICHKYLSLLNIIADIKEATIIEIIYIIDTEEIITEEFNIKQPKEIINFLLFFIKENINNGI